MSKNIITCKECAHYKIKDDGDPLLTHSHSYVCKCTYWGDRVVKESDYCSRAVQVHKCELCKYCKPLAGTEDLVPYKTRQVRRICKAEKRQMGMGCRGRLLVF